MTTETNYLEILRNTKVYASGILTFVTAALSAHDPENLSTITADFDTTFTKIEVRRRFPKTPDENLVCALPMNAVMKIQFEKFTPFDVSPYSQTLGILSGFERAIIAELDYMNHKQFMTYYQDKEPLTAKNLTFRLIKYAVSNVLTRIEFDDLPVTLMSPIVTTTTELREFHLQLRILEHHSVQRSKISDLDAFIPELTVIMHSLIAIERSCIAYENDSDLIMLRDMLTTVLSTVAEVVDPREIQSVIDRPSIFVKHESLVSKLSTSDVFEDVHDIQSRVNRAAFSNHNHINSYYDMLHVYQHQYPNGFHDLDESELVKLAELMLPTIDCDYTDWDSDFTLVMDLTNGRIINNGDAIQIPYQFDDNTVNPPHYVTLPYVHEDDVAVKKLNAESK